MYFSRCAEPPPYHSPRLLGNIVMFLLAGVLILNIATLWATLLERDMLQTIINDPVAVKFSDLEANNSRLFTISIAQVLILIPTIIAFVVWMYRSYKNVLAWGTVGLRYHAYWAWLGFLIPVVNFFLPFQVATEIWKASNPTTDHSHPPDWRKGKVDTIIALWWGSFFLTRVVDQVLGRNMQDLGAGSSMGAFLNANLYVLFATTLNIMALVVAIIFVYRLSTRQEQKFMQLKMNPFPFDLPTDFGLEPDPRLLPPAPREKSPVFEAGMGL